MSMLTAKELYAQLYDARVKDWPGELDFYRDFLSTTPESSRGVLEIACGTGRVTLPLSRAGYQMTGLDISPELLEIARQKSTGTADPDWVLTDMRTFELDRKFGVVISPGHSFQFMLTPGDQVRCLEQVKRHLVPGGWLILHLDHQNVRWLAGLLDQKAGEFEPGSIIELPGSHERYQYQRFWGYEPATQTATVTAKWQKIGENDEVVETWLMDPMPLHCAFRTEVEHLLVRCGFTIQALYGDFYRNPLTDDAQDMLWVARNNI